LVTLPVVGAGVVVGACSRAMLLAPLKAKRFRPPATVGAHPVRDALALGAFKGKSFRLPAAAESLSLCVAKEKVTKEKGHPASAPDGHPVHQVRGRATGFVDRASCPDAKLAGIPAGHPAGFPSPTRRAIGAPGRAARSQRALFRRARSRAGAKPQQSAALLWPLLFSFITECGPGWPAALPGVPCAAVRRGRQAAQRALPGMATPFRAGRSPLEKPGPDSRTCRPWMGGRRQAGGRFVLGTSLLDKQKRSSSAAAGRRKLLL
jgi:hypothetical protein